VEPDDTVKGYEYEKGAFIPIEDEDIEHLRQESKHTIDLVQFADLSSVDPIYFDRPFYVAPDNEMAGEAYVTVRDALRKSGKVAIGQVVIANRERIVALRPCGKGLLLETLRYNYEVREAEQYFLDLNDQIKPGSDQLDLARELIDRKSADFEPKAFKDLYQEGLKEIIQARLEKRASHVKGETKASGRVINIMDALRRSLEQVEEKPRRSRKPAHKSARKAPRARKGKVA
jgi:DNA end-binding protein Ku